ncbi:hypothetical protein TVAG_391950 [Trichomonas vaginalis G3]|uniref:DUF3447 domain-containing protein n=1 Tax=Trichomonas vaginalis (strain ATCC PRA-98 / G3) TaxID=412133 RepID=A2DFV8_TRIV3|nr:protein ubiquitination [Trichomonas vaginalis G3]EAY20811.1 hypothetical protein TVAG_391950 [Trichomonas vaginalis G3]KAI5529426.1 protein ubiquitination [Trichomonas vaginalis G3]|eukprot:XP_001581797.1 hypothetical protein [Trichomonas vaginalis G3]
MNNDFDVFITFTESEEFYPDLLLNNDLYPSTSQLTLLELCCYHGAVDCFKLLRTKFENEITETCLQFSFLGGNPEIMSECLKFHKPDEQCMKYAIISHNIDFVTFLINEHMLRIGLYDCVLYHNLESFLVYFDQTNDINQCFFYSVMFNIPSLSEYFLSEGANINQKDKYGRTALHITASNNYKETAELLISHGININENDNDGKTAFCYAALKNSKETAGLLISYGGNINEKNITEETALRIAAEKKIR